MIINHLLIFLLTEEVGYCGSRESTFQLGCVVEALLDKNPCRSVIEAPEFIISEHLPEKS